MLILAGILCGSTAIRAVVRDGQLDAEFVINPITVGGFGSIKSFVSQPDGKIFVIGGSGSRANGISRLKRLSLDSDFSNVGKF